MTLRRAAVLSLGIASLYLGAVAIGGNAHPSEPLEFDQWPLRVSPAQVAAMHAPAQIGIQRAPAVFVNGRWIAMPSRPVLEQEIASALRQADPERR